jgi:23S rRNA pseudouridine955/2504/2580 synthase
MITDSEQPERVVYREVDAEHAGQRIDNYLLHCLKGVPRSHVYRLVRSGQVRVNSSRVAPSYRLHRGDRLRIPPVRRPSGKTTRRAAGDLAWLEDRIVYEDDHLMLIDKPAGMAVHGGSGINLGCIEALRILRPSRHPLELVHRLDRSTSGCLLIAKRRSTLRFLHGLLREQRIDKRYLALVRGRWPTRRRKIGLPLQVSKGDREARVRVGEPGRPAVSRFKALASYGEFATLVEVSIETGRTHQIRVHAAHLGHAIAGDERYGDRAFDRELRALGLGRMFLHAYSVSFEWTPRDRMFGICLPLPADLRQVLGVLPHATERIEPPGHQDTRQPNHR